MSKLSPQPKNIGIRIKKFGYCSENMSASDILSLLWGLTKEVVHLLKYASQAKNKFYAFMIFPLVL